MMDGVGVTPSLAIPTQVAAKLPWLYNRLEGILCASPWSKAVWTVIAAQRVT
jgi:hypothetical protein